MGSNPYTLNPISGGIPFLSKSYVAGVELGVLPYLAILAIKLDSSLALLICCSTSAYSAESKNPIGSISRSTSLSDSRIPITPLGLGGVLIGDLHAQYLITRLLI